MYVRKLATLGITVLSLGAAMTATQVKASAHSFFYWERPHWVTVRKTTEIAKIHNTYPLCNSYAVGYWIVYPGYHLKVHHGASYDWLVESGKFNTNSYYTYAVERGSGTKWFRQGIH